MNLQNTLAFHGVLSASKMSAETPVLPLAITDLTATLSGNHVVLTWSNPADVNFSYTMLTRKEGGYPSDVGDGTVVYIGSAETFTDIGADASSAYYYYRAFSVSKKGVVNNETDGQQTDIGAHTTDIVRDFTAVASGSNITVSWTNPTDAYFAGVKIRYSTTAYPASVDDGTLLYEGNGTTATLSDVPIGITYYFRAFTVSTDDVVNAFIDGQTCEITTQEMPSAYGFAVDETNSDPYTAVSYIEGAVGLTPATNVGETFNGGDWLNVYPFNEIRVVALDNNGTVIGEVNQSDFTKFVDGTSTADKNLFVEIPPVYWEFTKTTNGYEVRWSGEQVSDTYKALAHSRGGVLKGKLYIAVYEGTINGTAFSCCTGGTRTTSISLTDVRTAIDSTFGATSGFESFSYYSAMLLQILFVSMFKTLNSQSIFNGRSGGTAITVNGGADANGMYYGSNTYITYNMKFMGIENLWSNYQTWVDGIYVSNSNTVRINDKSVANFNTDNYQLGVTVKNPSDKYITSVSATTEAGFLNVSGTYGSETTYYTDTQRFISSYPQFAFGGKTNGGKGGIFSLDAYWSASETDDNVCSRLEYLPW